MQSCTSVVLTQEELIDFVEENFGIRIPTSLLPTDWYIAIPGSYVEQYDAYLGNRFMEILATAEWCQAMLHQPGFSGLCVGFNSARAPGDAVEPILATMFMHGKLERADFYIIAY